MTTPPEPDLQIHEIVDVDGLVLALDGDAAEGTGHHVVPHHLVGALADDDVAGGLVFLVEALEPGAEVHLVSDDRVREAL